MRLAEPLWRTIWRPVEEHIWRITKQVKLPWRTTGKLSRVKGQQDWRPVTGQQDLRVGDKQVSQLSQENRMLQKDSHERLLQHEQEMAAAHTEDCCKSDSVDPCSTGTGNCYGAEQEAGSWRWTWVSANR